MTDTNYASTPGGSTSALCSAIKPRCDTVPTPTPTSDFIWQPSAIHPGDLVSFSDTSSDTPSAWSWSFQSGSPGTSTVANPQVRFSTPGQKTVTLTASNASGAGTVATKVLTVIDPNPGGGELVFTVSPASPSTSQVVTFDASPSTFLPDGSAYSWDFSDGGPAASGMTVLHAFAQPGTYAVALTVAPPGCLNATCLLSTEKNVTVSSSLPPPSADFTTDASCQTVGAVDECQAGTGRAVALTAVETTADSYSWNFGDGSPLANGKNVSHAWANAGSFVVTLTVTKTTQTATTSRTFAVVAPPNKTVLIPSVFDGVPPVLQSNDLYVYNPGAATLGVTLEFRKRGTPDVNPPRRTAAIAPHATAYFADALSLFGRIGQSGFVTVLSNSTTLAPIVTALDSTARNAGQIFALAVPGALLPSGAAPSLGSSVQHLVGLNDTADRQSTLGVSNPRSQTVTYRLKFFDKTGAELGQSSDLDLAPYSQAQFGVLALRNRFGVTAKADYRVVIEGVAGPSVHPSPRMCVATGDISITVPELQPAARATSWASAASASQVTLW